MDGTGGADHTGALIIHAAQDPEGEIVVYSTVCCEISFYLQGVVPTHNLL